MGYVQEQMGLAGHAVEDPGIEMDPEERTETILALKKKWDHTNRQYQLCTHKVDFPSFGDKARKRGLEDILDVQQFCWSSNGQPTYSVSPPSIQTRAKFGFAGRLKQVPNEVQEVTNDIGLTPCYQPQRP